MSIFSDSWSRPISQQLKHGRKNLTCADSEHLTPPVAVRWDEVLRVVEIRVRGSYGGAGPEPTDPCSGFYLSIEY